MPDEDKNFGGFLVLDFRKWWRHVKTIYIMELIDTPQKLLNLLKEESLFPNINNHPEYDHMVPASWTLGNG